MTVGDRIALMHEGHLQMLDSPSNVYHRPANVFTAKFIGSPSTNIFQAHYADRSIHIGKQAVRLPEYWSAWLGKHGCREFYLGIRPEHIKLEREKTDNVFTGTVRYVEEYGNRCGVYFDLEDKEVVAICDKTDLKPGKRVSFGLDVDKIHVFDKHTTMNIGYPEVYHEHVYQYQSI